MSLITWASHEHSRRIQSEMAGDRAMREAAEAGLRMQSLQADIDRLLMITEALWSILKEQHGYSDDELIRRMREIDLRDGVVDGKLEKHAQPACPKCHRTLMKNQPKCLYCDQEILRHPFER